MTSEVVNFYPVIAGWGWFARIGRFLYNQTQLRIHVIVTNAFLRSLANLDLEPSRVGAAQPEPQLPADDLPQLRPVVASGDRADGARAGAHRDRLGGGALRADEVHALEHLAVGDAGGGEEDVLA